MERFSFGESNWQDNCRIHTVMWTWVASLLMSMISTWSFMRPWREFDYNPESLSRRDLKMRTIFFPYLHFRA
jgi:hypothetical protein